MSLHNIKFVSKISLVSISFWLVSVLGFLGHPVFICTKEKIIYLNISDNDIVFLNILYDYLKY